MPLNEIKFRSPNKVFVGVDYQHFHNETKSFQFKTSGEKKDCFDKYWIKVIFLKNFSFVILENKTYQGILE